MCPTTPPPLKERWEVVNQTTKKEKERKFNDSRYQFP